MYLLIIYPAARVPPNIIVRLLLCSLPFNGLTVGSLSSFFNGLLSLFFNGLLCILFKCLLYNSLPAKLLCIAVGLIPLFFNGSLFILYPKLMDVFAIFKRLLYPGTGFFNIIKLFDNNQRLGDTAIFNMILVSVIPLFILFIHVETL